MTDSAEDDPARRDPPGGERGNPPADATVPLDGASCVVRFATLRPGALFAGRYEIRAHLGTGGAGEVHEAEDRVAGETVALKVLFPHLGEEDALERLRRELHAVRHLHHPGIVHVHDIGQHDGLLFLVMERLHGEPLAERLKRRGGPLAPAEIRRILRGILDALAAAHREGVLHRDVKPANVFLARNEDGEERVVLLDFGLARRLRRAWRAGGRKRAAILAATAAALLLAAFVLFFPWRLEARRGETILRARSLAGLAVRTWRAPAPLSGEAVRFPRGRPWTRTWYVGLLNDTRGNCRRPFPPEAPLEVRREVGDAFAGGVHGAAPGYDGIVGTPQLLAPRGLRGYGTVPLLAIAWAHQGHSPSVLALVDPTEQARYRREQRYWYLLDCPGRLVMPPVTVTAGPERATHRLLVLSTDQPFLDGRQAVVAVDPVLASGRAVLSPFSTARAAEGRPTWTTFTSQHESGRLFASGPGQVELRVKDRAGPLVLDARTGVPVRPGDRGGLPEDTWRTARPASSRSSSR